VPLKSAAWHPLAPTSPITWRCSKPRTALRRIREPEQGQSRLVLFSGVMMLEYMGWNEAAD